MCSLLSRYMSCHGKLFRSLPVLLGIEPLFGFCYALHYAQYCSPAFDKVLKAISILLHAHFVTVSQRSHPSSQQTLNTLM